jgi:hypothetical protein
MADPRDSSEESEYVEGDSPEEDEDDDESEEDLKASSQERFELSQAPRRSSKRRLASEHLQYDSNELAKKESPPKMYERRQVVVRTKDGTNHVFRSASEAHRFTGISSKVIKGICDAGGGFHKSPKRKLYYLTYKEGDSGEEDEEPKPPAAKKKRRKSEPKPLPLKLEPFNVSTLLPLTRVEKPTTTFKIELICKLTGEVHACFPNVEYAAQALNVEPSVVRKACKSFGEVQFDEDLPFCQLRYVQKSTAYEYGAHARDFFSCEETHEERLERWAKLQKTTQAYHQPPETIDYMEDQPSSGSDESLTQDKAIVQARSPEPKENEAAKEREEQQEDTQDDDGEEERGNVSGDGDDEKEEGNQLSETKTKEIMSFLQGATIWPESSSVCIACQAKDSSVVLEPCHHRVLCRECAEKWCPYVCPRCLIPIQRRVEPAQCVWIQPNVNFKSSFL